MSTDLDALRKQATIEAMAAILGENRIKIAKLQNENIHLRDMLARNFNKLSSDLYSVWPTTEERDAVREKIVADGTASEESKLPYIPEWLKQSRPYRLRADHSVTVIVTSSLYATNVTFRYRHCPIAMEHIIFDFLFEPCPPEVQA